MSGDAAYNKVIFIYSIDNLSKKDKVRFFYGLKGRKKDGLLFKTRSYKLGRGVVLVDRENEKVFEEFFNYWKNKWKKIRVKMVD